MKIAYLTITFVCAYLILGIGAVRTPCSADPPLKLGNCAESSDEQIQGVLSTIEQTHLTGEKYLAFLDDTLALAEECPSKIVPAIRALGLLADARVSKSTVQMSAVAPGWSDLPRAFSRIVAEGDPAISRLIKLVHNQSVSAAVRVAAFRMLCVREESAGHYLADGIRLYLRLDQGAREPVADSICSAALNVPLEELVSQRALIADAPRLWLKILATFGPRLAPELPELLKKESQIAENDIPLFLHVLAVSRGSGSLLVPVFERYATSGNSLIRSAALCEGAHAGAEISGGLKWEFRKAVQMGTGDWQGISCALEALRQSSGWDSGVFQSVIELAAGTEDQLIREEGRLTLIGMCRQDSGSSADQLIAFVRASADSSRKQEFAIELLPWTDSAVRSRTDVLRQLIDRREVGPDCADAIRKMLE